jgi:tetratricopeptide (TPR) repeat protein
MAEISLRVYLKEIEDLIERDHLDEAIAHSKRILEIYPKHLDTYRLLGKSYLESKRYGDAADIFQRVLSAIPDDFVSHIGMAIVREDEGNLDSAIWHMERAFETNPANPAIRQELRRLIGNRDGLEPHKVRMTRGALARMYAQGELYPQAISELDFALKEDPDRPDLQILLAKMYYRMNQSTEAAEICNSILEKLPFCRDANRIMASILQATKKSEEASMYLRRIAALDPYAAFVETAGVDPKTVSADSVRIAKMEWSPGQPMPAPETGQPDWAVSLGVSFGEEEPAQPEPSAESSWMEDLEMSSTDPESEAPNTPPQEPGVPMEPQPPSENQDEPKPEAEEVPPEGADIPDWMREAGWGEASGEAQEGPVSFSEDEIDALDRGQPPTEEPPAQEDAELTPAEIPDWVQQIAPSEAVIEADEGEGTIPNWLGDIAADAEAVRPEPSVEATPPASDPVPEAPPLVESESPSEEALRLDADEATPLPAWLDNDEPGATSTIITWLDDRAAAEVKTPEETPSEQEQAGPVDLPFKEEPAAPEEGIPDWLGSEAEEPLETPKFAEQIDDEPTPTWLAGVAEAAKQPDEAPLPDEETLISPVSPAEIPDYDVMEIPEEEPVPTAEAPDWIQNISADKDETLSPIPQEAPDWLDGIAEPEELPLSEDAIPNSQDPPDWLKGIAEPVPEPEPERADAAPDWLDGIAEPEPEPVVGDQDWLKDLREAEAAGPEEPAPTAESSDWLQEFAEDGTAVPEEPVVFPLEFEAADVTSQAPVEQEEIPTPIPEPSSPPEPSPEIDDQEIFDWLEDLAAKQESVADEVEPIPELPSFESQAMDEVTPETPTEAIPEEPERGLEWLDQLASERGIDVDVGMQPVFEEESPIETRPEEDALVIPERTPEEPEIQPVLPADVEAPLPVEEVVEEAIPSEPIEEPLPVFPEFEIPPEIPLPEPETPEMIEEQVQPEVVPGPALEPELDAMTPTEEAVPPLEADEDLVPEWLLEPEEMPYASAPVEEEVAWREAIEPLIEEIPTVQPEPEVIEPTPIMAEEEIVEPELEEPVAAEPALVVEGDMVPEPPAVEPVAVEPTPVEEEEIVPEPAAIESVEAEPPLVVDEEIVPEPVAIEPLVVEPVPVVEEEIVPEPAVIEPAEAEPPPVVEEEIGPEPVAVEPVAVEPAPVVEEEIVPEPVTPEPVTSEPVAIEPAPIAEEEIVSEPLAPEPVAVEPVPVAEEERVPEPVAAEPAVVEPKPIADEEIVPEPVATAPVTVEAPPPPPVKPKAPKPDASKILEDARQALASDDLDTALAKYSSMIKRKMNLQTVIDDLRLALDRNPKIPVLWQALGDAYMKANKLSDAIQAYKHGTDVA